MSEEPPENVAAEPVEESAATDSVLSDEPTPAAEPVEESAATDSVLSDEPTPAAEPVEESAVIPPNPAAKPAPPAAPPKPGLLVVATAQETREQFRQVFSSDPGFVVIDAVVPADAGQAVTAHSPRVVLIVVEGRDEEFAALRDAARAAQGATRVIALSRPNIEPIHVLRAAEEGAHGHWTTAVGVRNLPIWIRQAAAGTVRMEDRIREVRGLSDAGPRSRRSLRWQHLAALQLLARGSSNAQEVAWKLGIPRDKAHTLVEQACRCMEAQTPGEAVQTALSQGLIRS